MPASIFRDYPTSPVDIAREFVVGPAVTLLAGVLFLCAFAASVVAIPTSALMLSFLLSGIVRVLDPATPLVWPMPGFPSCEVAIAWVLSMTIFVLGIRRGLGLLRRRRDTILFLRRFGFSDSMRVITFAVVSTLGSAWELITLDDEETIPVGVDAN